MGEGKPEPADTAEEIAALKAELAAVKRRLEPDRAADERAVREAMNELHQARERQMSRVSNWSPDQLQAFERACPPSTMQDLVRHSVLPGPSGVGTNAGSASPRTVSVRGRGEVPFGPQPGIQHVDRLIDAQDAKDRVELVTAEAKRRAMMPPPEAEPKAG